MFTDIIQAIAATIGIIFLIINLIKTNEVLALQTVALRNSQRPVITANYNYEYLSNSQQELECTPISISVSKNPLTDLIIELNSGPAIDFSITEAPFGGQKFYRATLEVGERITLRYKVKEGYLDPPSEWPDEFAMNETLKLYNVEISLNFQDDNGYKYLQRITFNANIDDEPIVHRPEYLKG